jgi:peptidoglycan/LPS O-acetylase OafA/YrhL
LFSEHKKHGALRPKRFLVRRGLKIYPAFYAYVAGALALAVATRMSVPADRLLAEVLFVQNYYGGVWGHTWSLCVEEHFYLLLTACLFFLSKRARGRTPFRVNPENLSRLSGAGLPMAGEQAG